MGPLERLCIQELGPFVCIYLVLIKKDYSTVAMTQKKRKIANMAMTKRCFLLSWIVCVRKWAKPGLNWASSTYSPLNYGSLSLTFPMQPSLHRNEFKALVHPMGSKLPIVSPVHRCVCGDSAPYVRVRQCPFGSCISAALRHALKSNSQCFVTQNVNVNINFQQFEMYF